MRHEQYMKEKFKELEQQSLEDQQAHDMVELAVNPSHYKDIVPGYQTMQMMQYMLSGFEGVEAHLLGQAYKYLTRLGKKDSKEQDAQKAAWYVLCLVGYYKTGKIPVDINVEKALEK